MRNKFDYSCSVRIHALGFDELLESIFCLLLVVEICSLQKDVEMLEGSGSPLARGQVNLADETKLCSPIQLLKCWLCDAWLGTVMEKNWAHSVDQCWLQALKFSVHLIVLLRTLLI